MDFEDQDEEEVELGGSLQQESYETMNNRLKMSEPNAGLAPAQKPKYKECLKNHAVGIGGHAVDGCGEFMPGGPEDSLDALKCAACNCHRNFHRKDSAASSPSFLPPPSSGEVFLHHNFPQFAPYYRSPTGYIQVAAAQRPLALPSTSGGHSREDQEDGTDHGGSARKRFRTKFSQEQKEKMFGLAERLGWRIQKHDEGVVNEFCNETGVKRNVLKVWMHNNKHTLGKKP